jgi:glycogen synthase
MDKRFAAQTRGRGINAVMVTPRFLPFSGGVENHVYQVSTRMAKQGIAITVLTTDPTGELPISERIEGVHILRVRAWPADRDYYFAPAMYRTILHGGWNVVHIQSYHTLVPPLAMQAALTAGIPYVVTFHGGGSSHRLRAAARPLQRALLGPLLRRAACLVALARFEIEDYGRELRIPREKFVYIPNGSDLPSVPEIEAEDTPGTMIVSVGRLERYKGHQRIIAALPHILAQQPDVRLRIVGSGPYESTLRRLAAQLGISDMVEIGAVPAENRQRMAQLLAEASLMVLLSDFETHPISAMEALALKRPVLVADNSGMRELAERGWALAIRTEAAPEEVAQAVLQQLRTPIIPQGVEWFSWDDCTARLIDLYQTVANVA